jgi:hypothetical protein
MKPILTEKERKAQKAAYKKRNAAFTLATQNS